MLKSMNSKQSSSIFSSINHDQCPVEYICLNECCTDFRVGCFACIQRGKHNSHINEVLKISDYHLFHNQQVSSYQQFLTTMHDSMMKAQNELQHFLFGMQQKFTINEQNFNKLNVSQMNQALGKMIKLKDTVERHSEILFHLENFTAACRACYEELELAELTYLKKSEEDEKQFKDLFATLNTREKCTPSFEETKKTPNTSSQILDLPDEVKQLVQDQNDQVNIVQNGGQFHKILFLGPEGVGKTMLFKRLQTNQQIAQLDKTITFEELTIGEYQYQIIDSPAFELESSIEQREMTIELFKQFLGGKTQSVTVFAIIVNYDRIEVMRRIIKDFRKYMHKFKSLTIIIIMNWPLSQDKESEKNQIRKCFSIFSDKILFINQKLTKEELRKQLYDTVNAIPKEKLSFQNTILEHNQDI